MNSFLEFLHFIRPLSEELINYLPAIIKRKPIAKGHYISRIGHICRNIYFVEKGILRSFYTVGKKEIGSQIVVEGNVCTSVDSFFNQQESKESIQSIEDGILQYINYKDWENTYKCFPAFNITGRLLLQKFYMDLDIRRHWEKTNSARERYQWLETWHPELILRLPLKYIASHLGISDVMLSRIRAQRIS